MKAKVSRELKPTDVLVVTMRISVQEIREALFPEVLLDSLCADALEQFMGYVDEIKKCRTIS